MDACARSRMALPALARALALAAYASLAALCVADLAVGAARQNSTWSNLVSEHDGQDALLGLVQRFAGKRVLVVGDMVADEYIVGAPMRVSREAPVLILGQRDRYIVPGGATNPGVNA